MVSDEADRKWIKCIEERLPDLQGSFSEFRACLDEVWFFGRFIGVLVRGLGVQNDDDE